MKIKIKRSNKFNTKYWKTFLFTRKAKYAGRLKILIPKQMLQMLLITFAQVKAGNTSENLLKGIKEIIYFLYQAREITKKVYNNTMNSIKL